MDESTTYFGSINALCCSQKVSYITCLSPNFCTCREGWQQRGQTDARAFCHSRPLLCGPQPARYQSWLVAGIQNTTGGLAEQPVDAGNVQAWLGAGWRTGEQRALRWDAWLLVPALPLPPRTTLHKSLSEARPQFPQV